MKAKQEFIDFINSEQTKENFIIDGRKYILIKSPMKYENGYNIYIDNNSECGNLSLVYFLSTSLTGEIYNIQHSENISRTEKNVPILFRTLYDNFIDFEGKSYEEVLKESDNKIIDILNEKKEHEKNLIPQFEKKWFKEYNYEDIKNNHSDYFCDVFQNPFDALSLNGSRHLMLSGDLISAYNSSNLDEFIKEEIKDCEEAAKVYFFSNIAKKDFKKELSKNKELLKEKIFLTSKHNLKVVYRNPDNTLDYQNFAASRIENKNIIKYRTINNSVLLDQIEQIIDIDENDKILYDEPIKLSLRDIAIKGFTNHALHIEKADIQKWIKPFDNDKEVAEYGFFKNLYTYNYLDETLQHNLDFIHSLFNKIDDGDMRLTPAIHIIKNELFYKNKDFTTEIFNRIKEYPYAVEKFTEDKLIKDNTNVNLALEIIKIYNLKISTKNSKFLWGDEKEKYISSILNIININPDIAKNDEVKTFIKENDIFKEHLKNITNFNLLTTIFTIDELAENMIYLNDEILEDEENVTVLLGSPKAHPLKKYFTKIARMHLEDPNIIKLIGLTARNQGEANNFIEEIKKDRDMEYLQELVCSNYNYFKLLDLKSKEEFIWNETLSINDFEINKTKYIFKTDNGEIELGHNFIKISNNTNPYEIDTTHFKLDANSVVEKKIVDITYQNIEEFLSKKIDLDETKCTSYNEFYDKVYKYAVDKIKSEHKKDDYSR